MTLEIGEAIGTLRSYDERLILHLATPCNVAEEAFLTDQISQITRKSPEQIRALFSAGIQKLSEGYLQQEAKLILTKVIDPTLRETCR